MILRMESRVEVAKMAIYLSSLRSDLPPRRRPLSVHPADGAGEGGEGPVLAEEDRRGEGPQRAGLICGL